MKIDWACIENSANLKQGAHIHKPTAGPIPHACAQLYHEGSGSHRQLFRLYWGQPACQSRWVNERGKPASHKPPNAEVSAKPSIMKYQENKAKGTYTPTDGLAITSRLRTVISRGQWQPWTAVALTRAHQHGIAVGLWPGKAEASTLSASSTQHMWELLAGNRTAVLPRHAQGRQIMGLVYVCPLL